MKRSFIIITVIIFTFFLSEKKVFCQNDVAPDKWNCKIGYSQYSFLGTKKAIQENTTYTPVLKAQFNYAFLKYLDAGFYTGYTSIKSETEPVIISETPPIGYEGYIVNSDVLFYGINANFHIIPLIFNKKTYPFDIYISGKYGGFYMFTEKNGYPERGHTPDYGIYAGAAFYLGKHFGIFGEYGFGNYSDYQFGLSFKF